MATCTLSDLENTLQSLSFKTPIPQFPSSAPLDRPVDLIRIYLADLLHAIIECEQTAAYSSIGLSTDPNHGDLTVTMPRLVPGAKGARAAEVANDILTRVGRIAFRSAQPQIYDQISVANMCLVYSQPALWPAVP